MGHNAWTFFTITAHSSTKVFIMTICSNPWIYWKILGQSVRLFEKVGQVVRLFEKSRSRCKIIRKSRSTCRSIMEILGLILPLFFWLFRCGCIVKKLGQAAGLLEKVGLWEFQILNVVNDTTVIFFHVVIPPSGISKRLYFICLLKCSPQIIMSYPICHLYRLQSNTTRQKFCHSNSRAQNSHWTVSIIIINC